MTTKKEEAKRELVVLGAGALIESNIVLLNSAFANQDREMLDAQMVYWENLNKTISKYRQTACKQYDMHIASGYADADWAKGVERLVKKDENKPRGRKAAPKPNPAASC
jgi:hypothetical protein